jgi:hypothetical protein
MTTSNSGNTPQIRTIFIDGPDEEYVPNSEHMLQPYQIQIFTQFNSQFNPQFKTECVDEEHSIFQ